MKHHNVRVAIVATAGVVFALAQQGCAGTSAGSGGTAASAPPRGISTSPSQPRPSKETTTRPATSSPRAGARAAVCRSADLAADVTFQPDRAEGKTRMALVTVTNKSRRTCTVEGRAAISLANAAGEVVDVPTREVNQPGPAVPITLKAGRTAFQGLKWTACDKADPSCGVGNTLLFNLEASTDGPVARLVGFPAAERSGITMNSMSIGTLQPSAQGVVAW
jgi:hypothetical protein